MINYEKYSVTINASNHKHYSKWFSDLRCGQIIECEIWQLLPNSKIPISVKCDLCGSSKIITLKDYNSYGYVDGNYLCRKCKLKKNNLEKYGVENVFQRIEIKEKIKDTVKNKFGVDNVSKSEEIKNKKIKTNQINHGVDWPMQSLDIKNKSINTLENKWSVDNISKSQLIKDKKSDTYFSRTGFKSPFSNPEVVKKIQIDNEVKYGNKYSIISPEIIEKIKQTNLRIYGVENPSQNEIIAKKIKSSVTETLNKKTFEDIDNLVRIDSLNRTFDIFCFSCREEFSISWSLFYKRRETNTLICTNCNSINKHQSGLELLLYDFISSIYTGTIIRNHRIDNKELDIYLPELNIAFEFNGVYWHSDLYKSREYHKDKTDVCRHNNIVLFHIWEDDWLWKNDIVKSMISNKLGLSKIRIGARKCKVNYIDNKEIVYEFLQKNHLQGKCQFSFAVGLFFNDELLSVMCFIKRSSYLELNRYCTKIDYVISGGASKIFKEVKKKDSEIVTFSDNSYSTGKIYESLGFKKCTDLKVDYSYLVEGIRRHKFNFRKKENQHPKIWDAGKIKYRWSLNH